MFYLNNKKNNPHPALFRNCLIIFLVLLVSACVKQHYVSEPIDTKQNYQNIVSKDHRSQEFKLFLEQHQYPVNTWPITRWDLNTLTLAAIYFNPEINVLRADLEIDKAGEVIAGQRPNPTVSIPLEHHDGSAESPWFIGVIFDFLFERKEKRAAILQQAKARSNAAEIRLQQKVWSVYSELHQNLIEYFAAIKQKEMLQTQQSLLEKNLGLLNRRKELGQVSQFELSSIRLELQHVKLKLSDQNYMINNAFHNLIAVTGLQVDKLNRDEIQFDSIKDNLELIKLDEKQLQRELLKNRYDVRVKLKEYEVLEAALKLEIIKQYPDINLSPGFVFDQGSNVWALGTAWVLPLFHNHEGEIQEALAKRKHMQAEFIALQTRLINELNKKYQNYIDKIASYKNSKVLFKELEERKTQVQKQFDLGYSDQIALIQVKMEVEKVKQAIFAIEIGVMRAEEELERVTQKAFHDGGVVKKISKTL